MFTKSSKSIGLSLVAGLTALLLAFTPVAAQSQVTMNTPRTQVQAAAQPTQSQPGTDVNTASAPVSGWVTIPANSTQW